MFPCCLFFSSIMLAFEQTKVLLFQTNIEGSSSGLYYFFGGCFFFLSSFKYCGPKNKYRIVIFDLRKHFQGITTATLILAQFFQGKNILMFCSQKSKAKRKIFVKELQVFFSSLIFFFFKVKTTSPHGTD